MSGRGHPTTPRGYARVLAREYEAATAPLSAVDCASLERIAAEVVRRAMWYATRQCEFDARWVAPEVEAKIAERRVVRYERRGR